MKSATQESRCESEDRIEQTATPGRHLVLLADWGVDDVARLQSLVTLENIVLQVENDGNEGDFDRLMDQLRRGLDASETLAKVDTCDAAEEEVASSDSPFGEADREEDAPKVTP